MACSSTITPLELELLTASNLKSSRLSTFPLLRFFQLHPIFYFLLLTSAFLLRFSLLFLLLPISYSNTRDFLTSLYQNCRSFKCRSINQSFDNPSSPLYFLSGTCQRTSRAPTVEVTVVKVGKRGTHQITSRNFSALSSASAASGRLLKQILDHQREDVLVPG